MTYSLYSWHCCFVKKVCWDVWVSVMRDGTRIYALEFFCTFLIQGTGFWTIKRKKKKKKHFIEAGVPMPVNAVECYLLEFSWIWRASDKGFAKFLKNSYLILIYLQRAGIKDSSVWVLTVCVSWTTAKGVQFQDNF